MEDANAVTGRAWRLVTPLTGGYQNGAYKIEDDDGQYVLKWFPRSDWAERVTKAGRCVEIARAAGYPTPAWIAQGTTHGGLPFHVQEFVIGEYAAMDDSIVDEILRVNALQCRVTIDGPADWTWYLEDVVFNNHAGNQTKLLAAGDTSAELVRQALALVNAFDRPTLPRHEMVHGDFSLENLLVRDGRIAAVIDIEAIGNGCATFDLVRPAHGEYLWGDRLRAPRLMQEAVRRDGPAVFAMAVVTNVFDVLTFGLANWPEGIQGAAGDSLAWIADCRELLA